MGNRPCETDCAVFGMLAQPKWQMPGAPHEKLIKGKFCFTLLQQIRNS